MKPCKRHEQWQQCTSCLWCTLLSSLKLCYPQNKPRPKLPKKTHHPCWQFTDYILTWDKPGLFLDRGRLESLAPHNVFSEPEAAQLVVREQHAGPRPAADHHLLSASHNIHGASEGIQELQSGHKTLLYLALALTNYVSPSVSLLQFLCAADRKWCQEISLRLGAARLRTFGLSGAAAGTRSGVKQPIIHTCPLPRRSWETRPALQDW